MLTNPTYEQAKSAIFATATIPDGYNGHTVDVGFALAVLDWAPSEMAILAVWSHGWFRFLSMPRTETNEGWAIDALATARRVSNLRQEPSQIGAPLGTLTPRIGQRA